MTYYDIQAKTNSADTLSQEELFTLFSRAYHLLRKSLKILVHESSITQHTLIDLGAELAAAIDRNKSIFKRQIELRDLHMADIRVDKTDKSNIQKQHSDFLCLCMDLQSAMLAEDIPRQVRIVQDAPVSRRIYELVIIVWLNAVRDYTRLQTEYTDAILKDDFTKRMELSAQIRALEETYFLNPVTGYGAVRSVNRNMKAVRIIYNLVAKAYSRVVLKLARSQSTTQDCITDSLQNGHLGLIRAISAYDHVSNARFTGNTKHWVKQSMLFYMKEEANIIKISSNTWQHYAKLEAVRRKAEIQKGHLSVTDLAKEAGYSPALVESVYASVETSQVKSLDNQITADGFTLMNLVTTEDPSPSSINTSDLITSLPADLAKTVCLHYGLIDQMPQRDIDPQRVAFEKAKQILANSVNS